MRKQCLFSPLGKKPSPCRKVAENAFSPDVARKPSRSVFAVPYSRRTDGRTASDGERVRSEITVQNKNTHSASLMPMVEKSLEIAGLTLAEMDALAVVTGPGSFTGVRIGVATAKALAHGSGKPCIPVNALEALARSGHYSEAMDLISDYWGRMLDLGATTFWEDFNYVDARNAARIDEPVPDGKFDIHADGGAWCYVGLRHSFCHGWASGPTAWLSEHVLGVEPVEPGFRQVRIEPHLGNLEWAEGTVSTPQGIILVRHEKQSDGRVKTTAKLPKGVKRSQ